MAECGPILAQYELILPNVGLSLIWPNMTKCNLILAQYGSMRPHNEPISTQYYPMPPNVSLEPNMIQY